MKSSSSPGECHAVSDAASSKLLAQALVSGVLASDEAFRSFMAKEEDASKTRAALSWLRAIRVGWLLSVLGMAAFAGYVMFSVATVDSSDDWGLSPAKTKMVRQKQEAAAESSAAGGEAEAHQHRSKGR